MIRTPENVGDPPADMVVSLDMLLNEPIRIPYLLALYLYHLINDCLGYANTHLVILRLLIVVDH